MRCCTSFFIFKFIVAPVNKQFILVLGMPKFRSVKSATITAHNFGSIDVVTACVLFPLAQCQKSILSQLADDCILHSIENLCFAFQKIKKFFNISVCRLLFIVCINHITFIKICDIEVADFFRV